MTAARPPPVPSAHAEHRWQPEMVVRGLVAGDYVTGTIKEVLPEVNCVVFQPFNSAKRLPISTRDLRMLSPVPSGANSHYGTPRLQRTRSVHDFAPGDRVMVYCKPPGRERKYRPATFRKLSRHGMALVVYDFRPGQPQVAKLKNVRPLTEDTAPNGPITPPLKSPVGSPGRAAVSASVGRSPALAAAGPAFSGRKRRREDPDRQRGYHTDGFRLRKRARTGSGLTLQLPPLSPAPPRSRARTWAGRENTAPQTPHTQPTAQNAGAEEGSEGSKPADTCCVVCLTEAKSHATVPCGHQCLCKGCADSVMKRDPVCPVCRGRINACIKIYK